MAGTRSIAVGQEPGALAEREYKLETGIQTKGIIEKETEAVRGFQMIRDAGFTRVDFNLDSFLTNTEIYAGRINSFFDEGIEKLLPRFEKYKEAMDRAGIAPSQVHAPYPVRVPGNEMATGYMESGVIPKSIVIARTLGAPWVVVHPFKMQYTHGKAQELTENIGYFKILIPLLKEQGVGICFENLYECVGNRIVEGVCSDPGDAVRYVDRLNGAAGEELFGMCLDTGHLQLTRRDVYDYVTRVGSRIKLLHLHENDGVGDIHEMPYTFGSGERAGFDWEGLAEGLAAVGFDGVLSYETYPCISSFPRSARHAVLKTIHAAGMHLAERIEYFKANIVGENG